MFIDFFLILCTKNFLHIRVSLKRMILGSILGGSLSLIALFPALPTVINFLIDLISAMTIIFITFGKCNAKRYFIRVAVYFLCSFTFCGIMIFIYTTFKPSGMEIYNDVVYFNISPVLLIILTLVCYYILKLIKRLTKGVCGGDTCNVEICISDVSDTFIAKIDTGCNVKEPFSGEYVIIAERSVIQNIQPDETKMRIIPFSSLGGEGYIKGFKPNGVKIDGNELSEGVYIGICCNVIKGDIKALVPSEILK
ncbi:MAG: sigma-E processing peptidase SpoIIGA [Ruminococcus sp.]|nr:sigma-E processing peptidase SpoIIGA [Ruminococcus sp.]